MKIICFAGPKGSGKSFLAKKLSTYLTGIGEPSAILPLATPIKDAIDNKWFLGLTKEQKRPYYQSLGDWGRKINPYLWVEYWERVVWNNPFINHPTLIIDDLRFRDELEFLRRKHTLLLFRFLGSSSDPHISEHDLESTADEEWIWLTPRSDTNLNYIRPIVTEFLKCPSEPSKTGKE